MKLYATTTSERATKGQGGNRDIQITLNREKEPVYFIYFDTDKIVVQDIEKGKEIFREETKGKKQKGERISIGMGRTIPKF